MLKILSSSSAGSTLNDLSAADLRFLAPFWFSRDKREECLGDKNN